VTESSNAPKPKRASGTAAKPAATKPAAAKPVRAPKRTKALAVALEPTHRHPNLGLAPIDMTAGFPAAAAALRRDEAALAAGALEAAIDADPEFKARFDEAGLRRLLHDAEVLIERLALCVAGNDRRWLAEYAEWVGPIFRRRGVSQSDVAALCEGLRKTVAPRLGHDELAVMDRSLDAAIAVFKKNGRLAGDSHKRNALLKWLYRGV
jgi:hypothetical protein